MPNDVGLVGKVLDKIGIIEKKVMTLDNTNFGEIIPQQGVEELQTVIYDKSSWLSQISHINRNRRSSTVPVIELNKNISEIVDENSSRQIITGLTTYNVPYVAKKFRSDVFITYDDVQEAKAAGLGKFEQSITNLVGTGLRNDKADAIVNSDTDLASTLEIGTEDEKSRKRMLMGFDGLMKKSEEGNVLDAEGKAFGKGVFSVIEDLMPDQYANDPNLHWFYPRIVGNHYMDELQALATNLGGKALTERWNANPNGISPIVAPQISSRQGPVPIAPTGAVDGTTKITFDLTTLVTALHVASITAGVGRKFKVTCKTTGHFEYCYGVEDTQLKIVTNGLLGQTSVSTTASDYTVGLVDETDILLCNPKGITVVDCYEMRSMREYEPNNDRWHLVIYWYMAILITFPQAIARVKRLAVTPKSTW